MLLFANIIKNHYYSKTNITYLRYADDIIFYGFHKKEIFLILKKKITKFLLERGFSIKQSTNYIFQFKPKSAFSFLGYKYIFPSRFQKQKLNNGRFTTTMYTLFNIVEAGVSRKRCCQMFVIIDQKSYKTFKSRIRKIFKKGHFYISVAELIDILNEKMRNFALYFLYSNFIRIQLNSLDNFIRNWFWKWLKKKYGSKPKLLSFLNENFLNSNNFFTAEKKSLIPLCKMNIKSQRSFASMLPLKMLFEKNIFLESELYDNYELSQNKLSNLNFVLRNKDLIIK